MNLGFFRPWLVGVCLFTGVLPRPFHSLCPHFPVFGSPDSESIGNLAPSQKIYIRSI